MPGCADNMTINNSFTTTARATLENLTAGRAINLEADFPANVRAWSLSNAELANVSAAVLQIGRNDASASGVITVTQAIDLVTPGTVPTLHLVTGSTVTETGAGLLKVTNLAVSAAGAVTLNSANNNVATFAVQEAAVGNISFNDTVSLTVTTVDNVAGVVADPSDVTMATAGNLTLNAAVSTGSASSNTVRLQAAGDITQNAAGIITGLNLGVYTTAGTILLENAQQSRPCSTLAASGHGEGQPGGSCSGTLSPLR